MNFGVSFCQSNASVEAVVVVASAPVRYRAACQFLKEDCSISAKNSAWACSDKFTDEQRRGMCLNYCRLCKVKSGGKK
jgi:hypothetical protein